MVIPVELLLGGGRLVITPRAAEALGAGAQIDHPPQHGPVAEEPRLVDAIALSGDVPTAAAGGACQRPFDREDKLAIF